MDNLSFRYFFDIECLSAPRTINHESHSQHVLFRLALWDTDNIKLRCCSRASLYFDVYSCTDCGFHIHVGCALLPKATTHKFDKQHPLQLITEHHHHYGHPFCEVCEEDIDEQHWYYGCGECEYYFHIDCIPSVGYLSKVKFGETLAGGNIHPHPLTLTRMLTNGRHERCGYCKETIHGCVDEMAFHCSDCYFWIHFSCARDSSSSSSSSSSPDPAGATRHKTNLTRKRMSKVFSEIKDDYYKLFSRSTCTAAAIRSLTM